MPSQEEIDQQLAMLAAHRRTLAHLLQQAAVFGSIASVPPEVRTGIDDARAQIRHIKTMLRAWGIEVADHPDDGDLPGSHDPILSTPPMSLSIFVAIIIFLGTIVAGFFSSLLTRSPAPSSVIPTGVASNLRPTAVLPMITPTPPLSLSPTVSGQVEITYPSAMVLALRLVPAIIAGLQLMRRFAFTQ